MGRGPRGGGRGAWATVRGTAFLGRGEGVSGVGLTSGVLRGLVGIGGRGVANRASMGDALWGASRALRTGGVDSGDHLGQDGPNAKIP